VHAETAEQERWRQIRAAHPRLRESVVADALATMRFRGEGENFHSRLDALRHIVRLAWCSDAFLGQVFYRIKTRMLARGVPVVPRIAHRLAMTVAQISIGDPVVVEPGMYVVHGQVVVDGLVRIGAGVVLAPFVTIGLRAGDFNGPTLEPGVQVGTGAKIIGPVRVGAGARIGANAVVVEDVASGDTVVGVPARSRRV
jgi:serine O-acetyltransferase